MDVYMYLGEPMFFHSSKNIEVLIERDDVFAIIDGTHMRLNSSSIHNYIPEELEAIKKQSSSLGVMTNAVYSEMVEKVLSAKHGFVDDGPIYETDATLTNTDDLILRGVRFKKHN